jgi:hypothetical protein
VPIKVSNSKINIMALQIEDREGVICFKGEVCSSHIQEVLTLVSMLVAIDHKVILNLCGLEKGKDILIAGLKNIKKNLADDNKLSFFSSNDENVLLLFQQINNPNDITKLVA